MKNFLTGFEKRAGAHYLRRMVAGNATSAALSAAPGKRGEAKIHAEAHGKLRRAQGRVIGAGLGFGLSALTDRHLGSALATGAAGAGVGHFVGKAVGNLGPKATRIHKMYDEESK